MGLLLVVSALIMHSQKGWTSGTGLPIFSFESFLNKLYESGQRPFASSFGVLQNQSWDHVTMFSIMASFVIYFKIFREDFQTLS